MARRGVHRGWEYKKINTVGSIIDRGEWGIGKGKRRVVAHLWDGSEKVTNFSRNYSGEVH